MPEKTRRLYWDSCVFLSYIEGHTDRSPHIEAFLDQADSGEVSIVTSTVSIVEVAFAKQEKDQKRLDDDVDNRINELWSASSPIRLVEYNEAIARRAKQLIRDAMIDGKSLRPMDAVHIATAAALEIGELHTYDERMQKHATLAQLTVAEPLTEQLMLALDAPAAALLAAGDPTTGSADEEVATETDTPTTPLEGDGAPASEGTASSTGAESVVDATPESKDGTPSNGAPLPPVIEPSTQVAGEAAPSPAGGERPTRGGESEQGQ